MTPQERQLVDELFDRLTKLETAPRDPEAERLIAEGAQRAPHALYALVQTALVQDEALKRANARIEALLAQLEGATAAQQQPQGSFLDTMREAVFGKSEPRGSVPSVHPQGAPSSAAPPPGYQPQGGYPPQRPAPSVAPQAPYPPAGYPPAGPAFGGGGSFLGTAASVAAGAVGGGLLLDGIRSMFGHHAGFGGYDPYALGGMGGAGAPWGGENVTVINEYGNESPHGRDDLARDAGIDNVGQAADTDYNQADDAGNQPDDSYDDANYDDANADDGNFTDDNSGGDSYDV